jgi:wyosine [tRNA(Phe)-imidazoG37] synthetase (radical SAM superfamily)
MALETLHRDHARSFATNRYVYPVLSRRSRGISLGVNLNPDKVCNFDCVYCQVDRRSSAETRFVALPQVLEELDSLLHLVLSGELYNTPTFAAVPDPLRRLNDIAFSGDGEPTSYRNFDEIVSACAEVKRRHGVQGVKMVLISNASLFHRPRVQRGLALLDANQGEIWAKLDAGTPEYFQLIDRTTIPLAQVLENITAAAVVRPLVIQSLFMRLQGEGPSPHEIEAFCERLREIRQAGGQLKLIQIYTVARPPAESFVTALSPGEVDAIVARVRTYTGLETEGFYGSAEE